MCTTHTLILQATVVNHHEVFCQAQLTQLQRADTLLAPASTLTHIQKLVPLQTHHGPQRPPAQPQPVPRHNGVSGSCSGVNLVGVKWQLLNSLQDGGVRGQGCRGWGLATLNTAPQAVHLLLLSESFRLVLLQHNRT